MASGSGYAVLPYSYLWCEKKCREGLSFPGYLIFTRKSGSTELAIAFFCVKPLSSKDLMRKKS